MSEEQEPYDFGKAADPTIFWELRVDQVGEHRILSIEFTDGPRTGEIVTLGPVDTAFTKFVDLMAAEDFGER